MATPELARPDHDRPDPDDPDPDTAAPAVRATSTALFVVAGLIAGLVAATVVGLSAADALVLLGIPDPGPVTTYGLPAVRAIGELAAAIAVGSLLFAAFLVPPQRSGVLDVGGYRAVRTASHAAIFFIQYLLVLVPLTLSDPSGRSFVESVKPENLWRAIGQVDTAGAWCWTAGLAIVVAVGSRIALRWSWTPFLLLFAGASLMPLALTGHSSAGGSHDLATNSLILHLVAASLWAGGLFALLVHARRRGAYTDLAARRFSVVAAAAIAVMALSGVVNARVRMPLDEMLTTTYGRLVVAKIVALVVLGVFGWLQRRRSLPALAANPDSRGALIRFAGGEAMVFAATIGLAVGLGRTPPPPPAREPTLAEVSLGYNLDGPPTLARLAFDWRFDLIYGTAAIVLAALYVVGVG